VDALWAAGAGGSDSELIETYREMDSRPPPIVLGRNGQVIDGNHRISVAWKDSAEEIEAFVPVQQPVEVTARTAANRWPYEEALKSDEAFELLDREVGEGCDWMHGGCGVLAETLRRRLGGDLWMIVDNGIPQHVVLRKGDMFFDRYGPKSEERMLRALQHEEGLKQPHLEPVDLDKLGEIPWRTGRAPAELTAILDRFMQPVEVTARDASRASLEVAIPTVGARVTPHDYGLAQPYLYHVTAEDRLAGILAHGLMPGTGENYTAPETVGHATGRIFFSTQPDKWLDKPTDVLLRVPTDAVHCVYDGGQWLWDDEPEDDIIDSRLADCFTTQHVAPELIEVVTPSAARDVTATLIEPAKMWELVQKSKRVLEALKYDDVWEANSYRWHPSIRGVAFQRVKRGPEGEAFPEAQLVVEREPYIMVFYNPKYLANATAEGLAEMIQHELIHAEQVARSEGYREQTMPYLTQPEEIEAYANDIVRELPNDADIRSTSSLMQSPTYQGYARQYGNDSVVMNRLHKLIADYAVNYYQRGAARATTAMSTARLPGGWQLQHSEGVDAEHRLCSVCEGTCEAPGQDWKALEAAGEEIKDCPEQQAMKSIELFDRGGKVCGEIIAIERPPAGSNKWYVMWSNVDEKLFNKGYGNLLYREMAKYTTSGAADDATMAPDPVSGTSSHAQRPWQSMGTDRHPEIERTEPDLDWKSPVRWRTAQAEVPADYLEDSYLRGQPANVEQLLKPGGHGLIYLTPMRRVRPGQVPQAWYYARAGELLTVKLKPGGNLFDPLNDETAAEVVRHVAEKHGLGRDLERMLHGMIDYDYASEIAEEALPLGFTVFEFYERSVQSKSLAVSDPNLLEVVDRRPVSMTDEPITVTGADLTTMPMSLGYPFSATWTPHGHSTWKVQRAIKAQGERFKEVELDGKAGTLSGALYTPVPESAVGRMLWSIIPDVPGLQIDVHGVERTARKGRMVITADDTGPGVTRSDVTRSDVTRWGLKAQLGAGR